MVVHNLDVAGQPVMPLEADTPLVVDPNAMLPHAVALKSFEPVATNGSQVVQDGNRVHYAANGRHPLYAEIRLLVIKTVGLADVLAEALSSNRL